MRSVEDCKVTIQLSEPVVSAICEEPAGKIERHVYFMPLSVENLKTLWEKSRHFHNIFGQEVEGDFQKFASILMNGDGVKDISATGLFWVIDDFVGVFYMTRIIPNVDALVHYIFFDKRHRGREHLIMEMIRFGFTKFGFNRISAELPSYASPNAAILLEKHLGFVREGRKRGASQNKQGWQDVILYGMLKSEAFATKVDKSNGSEI
jgi:RimJ/RimL family protein N-acetyltransferase